MNQPHHLAFWPGHFPFIKHLSIYGAHSLKLSVLLSTTLWVGCKWRCLLLFSGRGGGLGGPSHAPSPYLGNGLLPSQVSGGASPLPSTVSHRNLFPTLLPQLIRHQFPGQCLAFPRPLRRKHSYMEGNPTLTLLSYCESVFKLLKSVRSLAQIDGTSHVLLCSSEPSDALTAPSPWFCRH